MTGVYEFDQGNALTGRRTMPSRDFLIRQAILDAAAETFPATYRMGRLSTELKRYLTPNLGDWPTDSMLFRAIPGHFRRLVESYGGTVCRSR